MKRSKSGAIAVFDSGVGGLTVFRAVRRALPAERLVYFGDTARLPYGSKTREAVTRYSLEIGRFLCGKDIKLLVVACNSASALALERLQRELPVPVVGVIEPAALRAARETRTGVVGVIGTQATVASGAYQKAVARASARARVAAAACPLLVPLVEEGWLSDPVTEEVARRYLRPLLRTRMDVLILGCTHYPLLKRTLARLAGRRASLVDSGEEVVETLRSLLARDGLLRAGGRGGEEFYVTDGPERFRKLARRILGRPVKRVRLVRLAL
ncbi:MAG TPA: glutamate racemase [Elusimicrobiota bacterium]|nr:glutamate racemase [Elusimicrobiota bacterium]